MGVASSFLVDPVRDFPELAAAGRFSCSLDDAPVVGFQANLGLLQRALATLDSEVGFSDGAGQTFRLSSTLASALARLASGRWCTPGLDNVAGARARDRAARRSWSRSAAQAKSRLPGSINSRVSSDYEALEQADRDLAAAERTYDRASSDYRAVREERQEAEGVLSDSSRSQVERRDAARTLRRTRPILQRYILAGRALHAAHRNQAQASAALAVSIDRLNNPAQAVRDYVAVLRARPRETVTDAMLAEADACANSMFETVDALMQAFAATTPQLSPEVRNALVDVAAAAQTLARFPQAIARPVTASSTQYDNVHAGRPLLRSRGAPSLSVSGESLQIPTPESILAEAGRGDPIGRISVVMVAFRSGISRFMDNLRGLTGPFEAGAKALDSEAESYGEDLRQLQTALSGLGAALTRNRESPSRSIQAVQDAGLGAVRLWVDVGGAVANINVCAQSANAMHTSVNSQLDSRLGAYATRLTASFQAQISPELQAAYDNVIAALPQAQADRDALFQAHTSLLGGVGEVTGSFVAVSVPLNFPDMNNVPAPPMHPVPVPFPNLASTAPMIQGLPSLAARLENLFDAFDKAGRSAANSHIALADASLLFVSALVQAAIPIESLNSLPTPVEEAARNEELERLATLTDLWGQAAVAMPGRVATAAPKVAANTFAEIGADLEKVLTAASPLVVGIRACRVTAEDAYGTLLRGPGGTSVVSSVANTVAGGIQNQATGVLVDLQQLLNPAAGLPNVSATLQAAATLLGTIETIGDAAEEAYQNATAQPRNTLQGVDGCAASWNPFSTERDRWDTDFPPFKARIEFLLVTLMDGLG